MKECPQCHQTYSDAAAYCTTHGVPLVPIESAPAPHTAAPVAPYAQHYVAPRAHPSSYGSQQGHNPSTSNSNIRVGLIVGGLIVALGIIVMAIVNLSSNSNARPNAIADTRSDSGWQSNTDTGGVASAAESTNNPSVALANNSADREDLLSTLRRADQAEIDASRQVSEQPLYAAYTGSALRMMLENIRQLRNAGHYRVETLHNIDLQSFTISPDHERAQGRLVETWESVSYSNGGTCLSRYPRHTVPQTNYFVRRDNGWMIDSIDFTSTSSTNSVACDNDHVSLRIYNASRYTIHRLYVSAASESRWGPDQLGSDVLSPSTSFTLTGVLPGNYDIKFVDEDGDPCVLSNVSIGQQTTWTLSNEGLLGCEGYR